MSKKGAKKRPAARRRQPSSRRTTPVEGSGRGSRSVRRAATQPSLLDRVRGSLLLQAGIGAAVLLALMASAYLLTRAGVGQPAAQTPTRAAATSVPGTATRAPTGATPVATPSARQYGGPPAMTVDTAKTYVATIDTAKGQIMAELYPKDAPQTVNNFVFLARDGFYNGLTFHRVEPNFVIQGGDPKGDGSGGPGYTIPAEIKRKHTDGALAMARRGDDVNPKRDSSGSQFYITLGAQPGLDDQYTVFGQVTRGLDVARKIAKGDLINSVTIAEQ